MGFFSSIEGANRAETDGVAGVAIGTGITAHASVNTKGSWTELIPSTGFDADLLIVQLTQTNVAAHHVFLLDIGIGPSGSEVVLIPNILLSVSGVSSALALPGGRLPFYISVPAGSRLSARCQSSVSSGGVFVTVMLFSGSLLSPPALGRVSDYGTTLATSRGTTITPNPTADTKGSTYTEVSAATANPIRHLLAITTFPSAATLCRNALDIAIGAGGSERILVPDICFIILATPQIVLHAAHGPYPVNIQAGTRLSARSATNVTSGPSVSLQILGVD